MAGVHTIKKDTTGAGAAITAGIHTAHTTAMTTTPVILTPGTTEKDTEDTDDTGIRLSSTPRLDTVIQAGPMCRHHVQSRNWTHTRYNRAARRREAPRWAILFPS